MDHVLPVLFAACCTVTVAHAQLRIYETRSLIPDIDVWQVDGVASVDFSDSTSSLPTFFFDCNTTENDGSNIIWHRENLPTEFPVYPRGNGFRLELTSDLVTQSRLGEYICEDTATNHSLTLIITDANPAVCPVEDIINATIGDTVYLDVYVAGVPLVLSTYISWRKDGSSCDLTEAEVEFQNGNKRIVLRNIQTSDAGLYRCAVIITSPAQGVAFAFVELKVYGSSMLSTPTPISTLSHTVPSTVLLPVPSVSSSSTVLPTPQVGPLVPSSCGNTAVLVGAVLGSVLLVVTVVLSLVIVLLARKLHQHTSQKTFSPSARSLKDQMDHTVTNSLTQIVVS